MAGSFNKFKLKFQYKFYFQFRNQVLSFLGTEWPYDRIFHLSLLFKRAPRFLDKEWHLAANLELIHEKKFNKLNDELYYAHVICWIFSKKMDHLSDSGFVIPLPRLLLFIRFLLNSSSLARPLISQLLKNFWRNVNGRLWIIAESVAS